MKVYLCLAVFIIVIAVNAKSAPPAPPSPVGSAPKAAPVPRLLPYQGHLTRPKPGGKGELEAVPDGKYSLIFTLYSAPVGGEGRVWGPERHDKVVVNGGFVNVLLGSVTAFGDKPDLFSRPLYLGISVDPDGKPDATVLEMVPRQVVLPALFAYDAGHAFKADHALKADDATLLQGINLFAKKGDKVGRRLPAEVIEPEALVPAGTLMFFCGRIDKDRPAPAGWLVCDGTAVDARDPRYAALTAALADGEAKGAVALPDLRLAGPHHPPGGTEPAGVGGYVTSLHPPAPPPRPVAPRGHWVIKY